VLQTLAPFMALIPVVIASIVVLLLIVIRRMLRGSPRLRSLSLIYLAATVLLGAALLLDGEGLLPRGWPRDLLVTTLMVAWGYIAFDLIEDLLIERALMHRGVSVPRLARDIMRGLALIALIVIAVNQIFGVQLNSLLISSTVVSAVIGLALQDLLKNVVAGIALQIERPFASGDWLFFDNQTAKVLEMSWRATRMVTVDNTHIIVPNANLAQAQIANYTLISPIQALHVQIALGPDHPPNQVKEVLATAARAAEGVLSDPPPGIRLIAYGEYSVTYDIKFWMRDFDRYVETRDAVMTSAWYYLHRAGFSLPTPSRELFMHPADPHHRADNEAREHERATAALSAVELFSLLSSEELASLAEHARRQTFARGEILVRQGDMDDTLYVVRRGRVQVEAADEQGGAVVVVNELTAGDFFGELALLTGLPRRATVVAVEDTEALLVRRDAIGPLIERNPALAEGLSAVLERRVTQRQSALAATVSATTATEMSQPNLLGRIRSLFGLVG
jgi:small-conductance mechanosensitive channel/CRP-like cAMP-binding protein